MPKVLPQEWEQYVDPGSPEHTPTEEDLEADQAIMQDVNMELWDIRQELMHPHEDPYTYEENKFMASDPEDLWARLDHVRRNKLSRLHDPEEAAKLEKRLQKLEKEVYRHYVPYLQSLIYMFGSKNSPLRESRSAQGSISYYVDDAFDAAKYTLEQLQDLSEEETVWFEAQIAQQEEHFDQYKREPYLFDFEYKEENLYRKVTRLERRFPYLRPDVMTLDNEAAREEALREYDIETAQAQELIDLAEKMEDEDIKKSCLQRAESLYRWIEKDKIAYEAPREFANLDGRIHEVIDFLREKKDVDEGVITDLEEELAEMKDKVGFRFDDTVKRLEQRLKVARAVIEGVADPEDQAMFIDVESESPDWAWERLGLSPGATLEEAQKNYKKLVLKYHPDRNKSDDATNKLQKINEAFGFLENYYKKKQESRR